jgi:hypothetical protein
MADLSNFSNLETLPPINYRKYFKLNQGTKYFLSIKIIGATIRKQIPIFAGFGRAETAEG